MEKNQQLPNSGLGLGIAGFVLGIIGLLLAFFPCTFLAGMVLGILGASLCAVGLSQARKTMAPTGLILAGLIISIICTCLAGLKLTNAFNEGKRLPWKILSDKVQKWDNKTEDSEDFEKAFNEEFEKEVGGSMEDVLRNLEGELDSVDLKTDNLNKNINIHIDSLSDEEKARKLGKVAGKAVKAFVDEFSDGSTKRKK
jgi:hypothetical protein